MSKKMLIMSMLCSLFFMMGCSNKKASVPKTEETKTSEIAISQKPKEKTVIEEEETMDSAEPTKEEKVEQIISSLNQGFANFFTLSFEEKTKSFYLVDNEESPISSQLLAISENPNVEGNEVIEEMATSLVGFSEAVESSLGQGYRIELLNEFSDKGSFFVIENGEIQYPIFQ